MKIIESGLFNSEMVYPEFEIHHRKDDLNNYRPDEAEKAIQLHYHDFYEVYYFISGNVTYLVENKTYHLSPGDILFMSPLELHQPRFSDASGIYERIVLWVDSQKLYSLSSGDISFLDCFKQSFDETGAHLYHVSEEKQVALVHILDELSFHMQAPGKYSPLICDSLLTLLFANFHRLTSHSSTAQEHRRMSVQVANCVDYINQHLSEDLSLDVLTRECYISKQHLLRTFRDAMGFSIHQYIQKKRLLTARTLMQKGISPKEAAMQCGFSDYSVFYRAYRKEYNKSPSQE